MISSRRNGIVGCAFLHVNGDDSSVAIPAAMAVSAGRQFDIDVGAIDNEGIKAIEIV
jgi:hypothetical protein